MAVLRALVYRPGALGDTLVSLPAIAEIRRRLPEHRLSLLTEQVPAHSNRVSAWTVLGETGWFDDVYDYVVKASTARDRFRNLRLARTLRAMRYDAIFSLAPPRTRRQLRIDAAIFRGMLGARRYYAAKQPAWPPSVVADSDVQHEALRLLRIVNAEASDEPLTSYRFRVPKSELAHGQRLLTTLGVDDGQVLVGVAPGSARPSTTWPVDRFAAVGAELLRQFSNVVLLAIGGPGDHTLCERLCATWGQRSRNLAGRLTVLGSASVLARCATFIGNDSGSTHLAAMVGIPCVAIVSARNAPGQWVPLGERHIVLEDRPLCAGCMLDECVDEANKCLLSISSAAVVRAAASLLTMDALRPI